MKKKLAILLSISLLACSFGMAGCAAQKETQTEVSVTNLDVSQSKETADKASKPDEKSKADSSNSKETSAVSSAGEKAGKETTSSVVESSKTSSAETSLEPSTSVAEPSENSVVDTSQETTASAAEPSESTPTETSQSSEVSVPEPSQASQEIPMGTLTVSPEVREKYGSTYWFQSAEAKVNYQYPELTQEQFDEIISLRCIHSGNEMLYQEGIIAGTVDPSAPRLTLEKVKEIIADAKKRELESDKEAYKRTKTMVCDNPTCYGGYIFSEIKKIQPPDWIQSVEPGAWYYSFSKEREEDSTEGIRIGGRTDSIGIEYYKKVDNSEDEFIHETLYSSYLPF